MKAFFAALRGMFRTYMLAGLATLIPVVATIWILKILILWADGFFKSFLPNFLYPENLIGYKIPGIGIAITLLLILLVGVLTRVYFGKKLLALGDRLFSKLPFGKTIYKALKDFVSLTFSADGKSFKQVALVEYPRKGMWALCFVTTEASSEIQRKTKEKVVNVFLPTTPNPTSGYLLLVPEKDLIILEMKVETAMKIIISAGVVQHKEAGS